MQKQIRTLEILVPCSEPKFYTEVYADFITKLHAKISNEARVAFGPEPANDPIEALVKLGNLGLMFYNQDSIRKPYLVACGGRFGTLSEGTGRAVWTRGTLMAPDTGVRRSMEIPLVYIPDPDIPIPNKCPTFSLVFGPGEGLFSEDEEQALSEN